MSPPNHRVASNDQTQSRKHIASISVVVAVVVASVGIWWYMSPGRWLQQAELILVSDPSQADALAEAAINANTGKLSQAWLIRCRAQLALEKPLEALGAYALIKQPDQCAVSDWCALIEEAQAAHHTLLTDMAVSAALRLGSERARILTMVLPLKANTLSEPEVLELVQELRRLAGTSAESWRAIGVTEQIRGRFAESLEAYRQAVAQSDVSQRIGVSSRRELAQLLIVLGQFSAAEPLVAETLDAQITCCEDQLRLAQLRQATGDQVNAENCSMKCCSKSLTIYPHDCFVERYSWSYINSPMPKTTSSTACKSPRFMTRLITGCLRYYVARGILPARPNTFKKVVALPI